MTSCSTETEHERSVGQSRFFEELQKMLDNPFLFEILTYAVVYEPS